MTALIKPPCAIWETSGRLSTPLAPDAVEAKAKATVYKMPGKVVVHLEAEASNRALTAAQVEAYFDLLDEAGRVVSGMTLRVPEVPGKGWPWRQPTARSAERTVEFDPNLNVRSARVRVVNLGERNKLLELAVDLGKSAALIALLP